MRQTHTSRDEAGSSQAGNKQDAGKQTGKQTLT